MREEEAERERDRQRAGTPVADQHTHEAGKEPGHLGNDLSRRTLLETDLEDLARHHETTPNEDVRQALRALRDIDTGPFPVEER